MGQQLKLIKRVTKEEVYTALYGIDEIKAPGCDGLNSHFCKKKWATIGDDITTALLRGDVISVGMLYECFDAFSKSLGLKANANILVPDIYITKEDPKDDRSYLWTGGSESSSKALLSWEKACLPKTVGVFNILDVYTWNKASICKLLRNLNKEKGMLWVQWLYMYYGKQQPIWIKAPKQASWVVQKIIKNMLYTRDRLIDWGVIGNASCPLCNELDESTNHLFFSCRVSTEIWQKLLGWQSIYRHAMDWHNKILWAEANAKDIAAGVEIFRMSMATCVYHIRQERNMRVFQEKGRPNQVLIRLIIQVAICRGSKETRLARTIENLNFYP
ncbi:uncharacterized protein LOC142178055 [Nicotiana tabacum]|uniref:Uncharacterized protein LOC142178055 n=1 Tax=Nicotiana tabacum TaxID=4097 RepID=A0AC58U1Y1_TOBAC